jgi:hypothetical protein
VSLANRASFNSNERASTVSISSSTLSISESQPVVVIAYVVSLKVGEWSGKVNFLVVPLDDFEGNEFFMLAKAIPMPFLGGMLIMEESQPCFVKVIRNYLLLTRGAKMVSSRLCSVSMV